MTPSSRKNPDWPLLFGTLLKIKIEISEVTGGLWPMYLPSVAASEGDILRAEQCLGLTLPKSFRDFLGIANGWKYAFQHVDFLGAEQLLGGEYLNRFKEMYITAMSGSDWSAMGLNPNRLLPIGLSLVDLDVLVLDLDRTDGDEAPVMWLAGQVIEEWSSFEECFLSIIEYTRLELKQHRERLP